MTETTQPRQRRPRGQGSIYYDAARDRWTAAIVAPDGRRRRVSAVTRDEVEAKLAELRGELPAKPKPKGRRPRGDGSIFYDTTKQRWVGAVSLPNGKRRSVSAPTESEAAEKLRTLQGHLGSGGDVDSDTKLADFLAWWLEVQEGKYRSKRISRNTMISYKNALTPVITQLGKRTLAALRPEDVEWLLSMRAEEGMSRSTIVRTKTVLGQALDTALRRSMVNRNVAKLAEMPVTQPPKERRALTIHQAHRLLEEAKGTSVEGFVTTGLFLGLRPGELLGLTWDAIDLDAGVLEVRQALKREPSYNGEPERQRLGDVKTRRSRRTLNLPAPVVTALRAHRRQQREMQLAAGPYWSNPENLVFTSNVGTPIPPSNMNLKLKKVTERAGLGRWSMTELARHSAASLLSESGLSNEAIADVLGHESTRMLERHYRHPIRPTVAAHVAPMESILNNL